MAKRTGNAWMWCLIPIGVVTAVTGLIVGSRLANQPSSNGGRNRSSQRSR